MASRGENGGDRKVPSFSTLWQQRLHQRNEARIGFETEKPKFFDGSPDLGLSVLFRANRWVDFCRLATLCRTTCRRQRVAASV